MASDRGGDHLLHCPRRLGLLAYPVLHHGPQAAITSLNYKIITRQEMDWRQARGQEDRLRMESGVKEIRDGLVPRA
jgi:hypothetical protein